MVYLEINSGYNSAFSQNHLNINAVYRIKGNIRISNLLRRVGQELSEVAAVGFELTMLRLRD